MPQIRYQRLWCQSCKNWELFTPLQDSLLCKTCENPHVKTLLSDIPEEKIKEQQERYSAKESKDALSIYGIMLGATTLDNSIEITESDAGLKAQRERKREIAQKKRNEDLSEIAKYVGLERNKPCTCGSGKKFKQCCSSRIQELRLQYNHR